MTLASSTIGSVTTDQFLKQPLPGPASGNLTPSLKEVAALKSELAELSSASASNSPVNVGEHFSVNQSENVHDTSSPLTFIYKKIEAVNKTYQTSLERIQAIQDKIQMGKANSSDYLVLQSMQQNVNELMSVISSLGGQLMKVINQLLTTQ